MECEIFLIKHGCEEAEGWNRRKVKHHTRVRIKLRPGSVRKKKLNLYITFFKNDSR